MSDELETEAKVVQINDAEITNESAMQTIGGLMPEGETLPDGDNRP